MACFEQSRAVILSLSLSLIANAGFLWYTLYRNDAEGLSHNIAYYSTNIKRGDNIEATNIDDFEYNSTVPIKPVTPLPTSGQAIPNTNDNHKKVIKQIQKENYKNGNGLMINIHFTHHAGTYFCKTMRQVGPVPPKYCSHINNEQLEQHIIPNLNETEYLETKYRPWTNESTPKNIAINRKYFHMLSWEWGARVPGPDFSLHTSTNWEDPNLISVFITRHPISRLLATDGIKRNYDLTKKDQWRDYADTFHCDNFQLRLASDNPHSCCNGANTSRSYLEEAKKLLKRFTFVIDIACLEDGMNAIADELDISPLSHPTTDSKHLTNLPYRERVGFDDVYEYLLEKNKLDIELYEWARDNLAIVDCKSKNLTHEHL